MNQMGQRMTPTDVGRMVFRQALADFGYNQPNVTTKSGLKAIKSAKKIAGKAVKHFKKTGQVPSSVDINRISAVEARMQQIPMAGSPGFGGGSSMRRGSSGMSSMSGRTGGMSSIPRKKLSRSERRRIAQSQKRLGTPGAKSPISGSKSLTPGAKRSGMLSRRQRSVSPSAKRSGMLSRRQRSVSPSAKRSGMSARRQRSVSPKMSARRMSAPKMSSPKMSARRMSSPKMSARRRR